MPAEDAKVSVFDAGFMQGIGLFETMRAYAGRLFRLQRHLDRLRDSARTLGWTVLPDADVMADSIRQVLRATASADGRVRLTVTTGSLHADATDTPELTIVATAAPGGKYPDECYTQGVTVVVAGCRQDPSDPTVGHKTTSYFARLATLRHAHGQAAFEALWFTPDGRHGDRPLQNGVLAEGAISNVFAVRDEVLVTPPLDTPVLPGITRAAVLELAGALDIPARDERLTLEELLSADEVFLTNSMAEVVPVVRVGRQTISDEKPGDITRRLGLAYGELVEREAGRE